MICEKLKPLLGIVFIYVCIFTWPMYFGVLIDDYAKKYEQRQKELKEANERFEASRRYIKSEKTLENTLQFDCNQNNSYDCYEFLKN